MSNGTRRNGVVLPGGKRDNDRAGPPRGDRCLKEKPSMRRLLIIAVLVGLSLLGVIRPKAAAEPKPEPLVEQVRKAIDRGVQYLRDVEKGNGHWEQDVGLAASNKGGQSCLALLALLNAGVKPDDPIIERGLNYIRGIAPERTYVVGLQTMVYALAGRREDRPRIQANVNWLLSQGAKANGRFMGWGYGGRAAQILSRPDNSNTQYALLGLHEAQHAGAKIKAD